MTHRDAYTSSQKFYLSLLVLLIAPLGGMSTDIYLPSLPALSAHFSVTKAFSQLTVTSYVVSMGLFQLLAGPMSDAYGRKRLLILAFVTQLFSVAAIIFSPSVYAIILCRSIQGVGAAFMLVPARAIINDVFSGLELKKQFNYLTISFALGPIVAPFIGGYFQHYFGWRASFIFIFIYALLLLIVVAVFYNETLRSRRPFSFNHLWKNYQTILSHRYFVSCALFVAMAWGYGSLFNVSGPFLIQTTLQQTPIAYGHLALSMGGAWFLGNIVSRALIDFPTHTKTKTALWLILTTAMMMLLYTHLGHFSVRTFAIPTFIIILLSGFIFPIYIGECLIIFTDITASANACLFSLIWLVIGGFTIIATLLQTHSLTPLAITYISICVISLLFYYRLVCKG